MKMEYRTVKYDSMMWVTDPAGSMNPRSIQDYVDGGWHIRKIQVESDDEVVFFLERPAALGALRELQENLRYATSKQFEIIYGSGHADRPSPDECPHCGNTDTRDMKHEHDCPYGTLMQLVIKGRELIDKVT